MSFWPRRPVLPFSAQKLAGKAPPNAECRNLTDETPRLEAEVADPFTS